MASIQLVACVCVLGDCVGSLHNYTIAMLSAPFDGLIDIIVNNILMLIIVTIRSESRNDVQNSNIRDPQIDLNSDPQPGVRKKIMAEKHRKHVWPFRTPYWLFSFCQNYENLPCIIYLFISNVILSLKIWTKHSMNIVTQNSKNYFKLSTFWQTVLPQIDWRYECVTTFFGNFYFGMTIRLIATVAVSDSSKLPIDPALVTDCVNSIILRWNIKKNNYSTFN